MPTFGWMRMIAVAFPRQKCLAQTCTWRDNCQCSARNCCTRVERVQIRWLQKRDPMCHRVQVIEEVYNGNMQSLLQPLFVHTPRQIRHLCLTGYYWSGDPETGAFDTKVVLSQEISN